MLERLKYLCLNGNFTDSDLVGLYYKLPKNCSAFFLLSFLLVIVLSIYFISNIYQKWSATPIIIGLNAVATPISDFPFPAVTVCNMNQARRSIVEGFGSNSIERALLQSLCGTDSTDTTQTSDAVPPDFTGSWNVFRQFLLDVSLNSNMLCREIAFNIEAYSH